MSKLSTIDRQREHQANERTFLAWLRTSTALIGFGFAIARFGIFVRQLETSLRPAIAPTHPHINSENLGIGLVIFGIIVIGIALWSYNRAFWQIERGAYRPNRLIIWLTSIVVIIMGILSLTVMVQHEPTPDRNQSKSVPIHLVIRIWENKRASRPILCQLPLFLPDVTTSRRSIA